MWIPVIKPGSSGSVANMFTHWVSWWIRSINRRLHLWHYFWEVISKCHWQAETLLGEINGYTDHHQNPTFLLSITFNFCLMQKINDHWGWKDGSIVKSISSCRRHWCGSQDPQEGSKSSVTSGLRALTHPLLTPLSSRHACAAYIHTQAHTHTHKHKS